MAHGMCIHWETEVDLDASGDAAAKGMMSHETGQWPEIIGRWLARMSTCLYVDVTYAPPPSTFT